MTTLQYLVKAVDDFTPTFARMHETVDRVNRDLSKLDGKTATANAKPMLRALRSIIFSFSRAIPFAG